MCVVIVYLFSFLHVISLCEYTMIFVSTLLLMDMWVASSSEILQIILQLMFLYIPSVGHLCAFLLSIYLGMELLSIRYGYVQF